MKKLGILLLLLIMTTSMVTTTWATSSKLEEKIKNVRISDEIGVKGLPLEEVLVLLSKESGIRIIPVPEVATLKVDFQMAKNQTLEDGLAKLATDYGLTFQMNDKEKTIVVLKGLYIRQEAKTSQKIYTEARNERMMFFDTQSSIARIAAPSMVHIPPITSLYSLGNPRCYIDQGFLPWSIFVFPPANAGVLK